jgi:hypothetical protein
VALGKLRVVGVQVGVHSSSESERLCGWLGCVDDTSTCNHFLLVYMHLWRKFQNGICLLHSHLISNKSLTNLYTDASLRTIVLLRSAMAS